MQSGNFLTFSTAALASSVYFLVPEYIREGKISNSKEKSILLLWSAALGLAGIVVAFLLIAMPVQLTIGKSVIHWAIYILSLCVTYRLWGIEYQESGARIPELLDAAADDMTSKAAGRSATDDGVAL